MTEPRQGGRLQLVAAPEDREPGANARAKVAGPKAPKSTARRLAPGAPKSPSTVPLELAMELRTGEPVIWWNEKIGISWRPVIWMLVAGVALLATATAFAPDLWDQPLTEMWKPLVPALAPALILVLREWLSCRAVMVTDTSMITIDHRGRTERLAFRNVRRVRRDVLTGGVLLEGAAHKLRIPPSLSEDARTAIATQTRNTLRSNDGPDDPLHWLPLG